MAVVGTLADLDDVEHAVLVHSLESVPGGARVDIPKLLASVKAEAAEQRIRDAEERRANADPGRYEAHLREQGWRPSSERKCTAPAKPKGGVRRLRPQSSAEEREENSPRATTRQHGERVRSALSRSERSAPLGPRAFDEHGSIMPEPAQFTTPPWVIVSDEEAA